MSHLHINYKALHAELSRSCSWKPVRIQRHKTQRKALVWNENNRVLWVTVYEQGRASLVNYEMGFHTNQWGYLNLSNVTKMIPTMSAVFVSLVFEMDDGDGWCWWWMMVVGKTRTTNGQSAPAQVFIHFFPYTISTFPPLLAQRLVVSISLCDQHWHIHRTVVLAAK